MVAGSVADHPITCIASAIFKVDEFSSDLPSQPLNRFFAVEMSELSGALSVGKASPSIRFCFVAALDSRICRIACTAPLGQLTLR